MKGLEPSKRRIIDSGASLILKAPAISLIFAEFGKGVTKLVVPYCRGQFVK